VTIAYFYFFILSYDNFKQAKINGTLNYLQVVLMGDFVELRLLFGFIAARLV